MFVSVHELLGYKTVIKLRQHQQIHRRAIGIFLFIGDHGDELALFINDVGGFKLGSVEIVRLFNTIQVLVSGFFTATLPSVLMYWSLAMFFLLT